MKKILLLLALVLLSALPSRAFTGCQNLTLLNGWTCIDTNAVSGSGLNPTNLDLVHQSAVKKGDLIVSWANLVTSSWTTQTITITDNAGNTFTQWSIGLHAFSNPLNQWSGAMYYTVASADHAGGAFPTGYRATCTAVANGGAAPRCDDFSVIIIRPPAPLASVSEDITPIWVPPSGSNISTDGGGLHPNLVVSPSGQSVTTVSAGDIIIGGGNTDQASAFVDPPFIGMDGDGTLNVPFYYLSAVTQSAPGTVNLKWYVSGATTSAGSGVLALKPTFASNAVFITQSGGGAGTSCGSPQSFAYFNSSGNWVSSSPTGVQIGPGTIVHVCTGTYTVTQNTTALTFQGNGLLVAPVTLTLDSGAILQSPFFKEGQNGSGCGGAISMCGRSFAVVTGPGTIQNTANGDLLANHAHTAAIDGMPCTNCQVTGVQILNMYVKVHNNATLPGSDASSIRAISFSGSNWKVDHNRVDMCGWCLYDSYGNGDTNTQVFNNEVSNYNHGLMYAAGAINFATNFFFHDNYFHDTFVWSSSGCPEHDDGMHLFGKGVAPNPVSGMDGQYIYNNRFGGALAGGCDTGFIFIEGGTNPVSSTPAHATSTYIWNNVFDASGSPVGGGGTGSGWMGVFGNNETSGSGTFVLYNTLIYNGDNDNSQGYNVGSVNNLTFQGNVSWKQNMGANIGTITNTPASQIDYNTYAGACQLNNNCFTEDGSFRGTFAAWKAVHGWDTHSQANPAITNTTVKLNADGTPQTGSPVIKFGINLTSLATGNLATLSSDTTYGGSRIPVVRPTGSCTTQGVSSGCWDDGASQFNGTTAASPTASPVAGTYGPSQTVTLSTTLGTVICFTTNLTTPATNGVGTGCASGTPFTVGISVTTATTIKAIAGSNGLSDSSVATFVYTINGTAATPTFSPVAGTYSSSISVTISTTSGPLTFCYTTNGSTPAATTPGTCDAGSTTYSGPVTVASSLVLKAIATSSIWINSAVGSASYTITANVATPTLSPVSGTYTSAQTVTITTATGSATICYTIDGSTPTANGAGTCTHGTSGSAGTSNASLLVSVNETVAAIGTKAGLGDSTVGLASYVINFPNPIPPATIMLVAVPQSQQPVIQGMSTVQACTDATKPCAFRVGCSPCSAATVLVIDGKVSPSTFTPGNIPAGFVSGTAMPGTASHQISLVNP